MNIETHADIEIVAVEQEDVVTVMLELTAPSAADGTPRPEAAVQVVLDRSGSMMGERLEAARQALVRLVDRLDPSDRFGVVTFDDHAHVAVPAGSLSDKAAVREAILGIGPGGMTDLSAGLLRGLQEARRVAGAAGATVLLLSDGHANSGETDPLRLASVAASARDHGLTTSTIGIGLGYDERLLSELAAGGQGNHAFAEEGDAAAAAVASEVEGLLSKTVQAASLLIRPDVPVESVTIWNDVPSNGVEGGVMVELGDLWAGEQRKLVISFAVPAKPALGLARIAELELRYVALPDFVEQTVTLPLHVNVVPGDQAAGRIPDPKVRSELVYQQVQEAKRRASEALYGGRADDALRSYAMAGAQLDDAMMAAPSPELAAEREIIDELRRRAAEGETAWAAKAGRMEHARKSRTRGRFDDGM